MAATPRRALTVAIVGLGLLVAAPGVEAAQPPSHAEVAISDPTITGKTPGLVGAFAPRWRAAGIDVAAVTADWRQIAPATNAKGPPAGFDGADPQSPLYDWGNLDNVIDTLRAKRIEPLLTITGPGPLWSSSDPERGSARYRPSPQLFKAFVQAVVQRYRANVDRYIVWYEPNDAANLRPQFSCIRTECSPRSAATYRDLFNVAASAIRSKDPGSLVFAGALAGRGSTPKDSDSAMDPLVWVRSFGCVGEEMAPDRSSFGCKEFQPAAIDGLAIHPGQRGRAPNVSLPKWSEVGIGDTSRLIATLDPLQAAGGIVNNVDPALSIDLYYTEWGYQTNPPDVFSGVSLSKQSRWLAQGARIVFSEPRVKLLGQYLWRDEPVVDGGLGTDAYSGGQSGLYGFDGNAKPAARNFANPFWVSLSGDRRTAKLWGQVRPGGAHQIGIERRIGSARFRTVASAQTDAGGYFTAAQPIATKTSFRYYWTADGSPGAKRNRSSSFTLSPR